MTCQAVPGSRRQMTKEGIQRKTRGSLRQFPYMFYISLIDLLSPVRRSCFISQRQELIHGLPSFLMRMRVRWRISILGHKVINKKLPNKILSFSNYYFQQTQFVIFLISFYFNFKSIHEHKKLNMLICNKRVELWLVHTDVVQSILVQFSLHSSFAPIHLLWKEILFNSQLIKFSEIMNYF